MAIFSVNFFLFWTIEHLCVHLELQEVLLFEKINAVDAVFRIRLRVKPNHGLFEATLQVARRERERKGVEEGSEGGKEGRKEG